MQLPPLSQPIAGARVVDFRADIAQAAVNCLESLKSNLEDLHDAHVRGAGLALAGWQGQSATWFRTESDNVASSFSMLGSSLQTDINEILADVLLASQEQDRLNQQEADRQANELARLEAQAQQAAQVQNGAG